MKDCRRRSPFGGKADLSFSRLWSIFRVAGPTRSGIAAGGHQVRGWQVFPVLLAPNVVEHLGHVALKATFSRFVIGDPEVQYLGGVASAKVPSFLSLYREGHVEGNHYWPVRFEELWWLGEPEEIAQKYMGYPRETAEPLSAEAHK